jgi:hypothetical protein
MAEKWKIFKIIRAGQTVDEFEAEILAALGEVVPHAVILQVGINECGPRPLKRQERERLGRLRPLWLQRLLIRGIHVFRPHIIWLRGLNQLTPVSGFADAVRRIIAKAVSLHCAVLILPITQVSPTAERRQPFFNREIERYNDVLRSMKANGVLYLEQHELFGKAEADDFSTSPQSTHLNGWAHERITACVEDWLVRQVRPSAPPV